jgi:hypothetical protein
MLGLQAAPARAGLIASNLVTVEAAAGTIALASRLYDEDGGDPTRWRFEYELSGDFDPEPGVTNGLSSLQILFGGLVPAADDQSAPPGWLVDCCLTAPPFGVGFDLPGPAPGAGATGVLFSFTVPAGTAWTAESFGSFAGSHLGDTPVDFVGLVDALGGHGPIVPVPEPGTLVLLALGLATLPRRR